MSWSYEYGRLWSRSSTRSLSAIIWLNEVSCENRVFKVLMWSVTDVDSVIRKVYNFRFKKILVCNYLTSYSFVSVSQIFFVDFFSALLDNTSSACARCKLAIALPSVSSHFASVIPSGLLSIASRQLSFLNTAFIFIFHREILLPLNFWISNFAAILHVAICSTFTVWLRTVTCTKQ